MESPDSARKPLPVSHEAGDLPLPTTHFVEASLLDSIHDDSRSSSLSEIDETIGDEQLDISPRLENFGSEIDSEAETERIEESPNSIRNRTSIVLSGGTYGTSPSKLAQSTTYDELGDDDDDDDGDREEREMSPSKPPRSINSNGVTVDGDSNQNFESQETAGKKRKRLYPTEEPGMDDGEEEPSRKRRGSIQPQPSAGESPKSSPPPHTPTDDGAKKVEVSNAGIPSADDVQAEDTRPSTAKTRKGRKDKRKGNKFKTPYDETTGGTNSVDNDSNAAADEQPGPDEREAEPGDEANDPEAVIKMDELAKKTTAMDLLSDLERQFASLRDRIYDERIANINKELAQLEAPSPTHPEFLRQARVVQQHRDDKMKYEDTLFSYKLNALCTRSQAERSQFNSTYYQRVREIREQCLDSISEHQYKVQHDRFQTGEASPDFGIPFPSRLSKQVAQQTAYNTEVSVLSGFAKYVGFPAAPELRPTRRNETEEDFEKMGLSSAVRQ